MPLLPENLQRWREIAAALEFDAGTAQSVVPQLIDEIQRLQKQTLQPHQRAALCTLGAEHGAAARGKITTFYRAKDCDCEYCCAFEFARTKG